MEIEMNGSQASEFKAAYAEAQREIVALKDQRNELLAAMQNWLGSAEDPKAGWRGSGGTTELFACEYCNEKHGDCTKIEHKSNCPIPLSRAAIARATGETA